jgi:hypothetical protein
MQRILGDGASQLALFLVEDGDAHAQRAEVDPCHYAHGTFLSSDGVFPMSKKTTILKTNGLPLYP